MKTIQEQIAVMQAFADGKKIECCSSYDMWFETEYPTWDWSHTDYRIKPEPQKPKIVPYSNAAEFISALKEHGPMIYSNIGKSYRIPDYVDNEGICLRGYLFYVELLCGYSWQDGHPIGKEVME